MMFDPLKTELSDTQLRISMVFSRRERRPHVWPISGQNSQHSADMR
jgi:hypothetical protein